MAKGDFIRDISYNKKFKVENGAASISQSFKDSSTSWQKMDISRETAMELLRLRGAIEINSTRNRQCSFALKDGRNVRTGILKFKGESGDTRVVFLAANKNEAAGRTMQFVMTPDKYTIFSDCIQCYVDGRVPMTSGGGGDTIEDSAMEDTTPNGDVDEIYALVLSGMFQRYVPDALRDICYGCQDITPSQAVCEHKYCLEGGDIDASDTIFEKYINQPLLIATSIVAYEIWLEKNSAMTVRYSVGQLLEYFSTLKNLPFDFPSVTSINKDISNELMDPGKQSAVKDVLKLFYAFPTKN